MLIYQLRERIIRFATGANVQFPNKATVNIELTPPVPFRGTTGLSRQATGGQKIVLSSDYSTGRMQCEIDTPLFDKVIACTDANGEKFEINGCLVSVHSQCATLHAPRPTRAWGKLGEAPFHWLFEPSELLTMVTVTSKTHQEQMIVDSWKIVRKISINPGLLAGLFYFHVGCRLLQAGQNRFEFMGEAILNFAKCLQSLFGESRDSVRAAIKQVGKYKAEDIEAKFLPALVLRDEFDVAHVSLAALSREQLKVLHQYTDLAENAFRELLTQLLARIREDTYCLPHSDTPILSSKKQKILERFDRNIRPFIPGVSAQAKV